MDSKQTMTLEVARVRVCANTYEVGLDAKKAWRKTLSKDAAKPDALVGSNTAEAANKRQVGHAGQGCWPGLRGRGRKQGENCKGR